MLVNRQKDIVYDNGQRFNLSRMPKSSNEKRIIGKVDIIRQVLWFANLSSTLPSSSQLLNVDFDYYLEFTYIDDEKTSAIIQPNGTTCSCLIFNDIMQIYPLYCDSNMNLQLIWFFLSIWIFKIFFFHHKADFFQNHHILRIKPVDFFLRSLFWPGLNISLFILIPSKPVNY